MIRFTHAALARSRKERGFSLVETIVVVAILGVLVVVAIPVFGAIQANARGATLTAAANNAASAITAAVTNDPKRTVATKVVSDLNKTDGVIIQYTLANSVPVAPRKPGVANNYQGIPGGSVLALNADPEDVFVYAVDKHNNWIGVGTAAPTQQIAKWL